VVVLANGGTDSVRFADSIVDEFVPEIRERRKNWAPPPPVTTSAIYIERALINPSGPDAGREVVVLANLATSAQTLTNWRLVDKNARVTAIDATIESGQSILLTLDGTGAQLGNQGGNLMLQDSHNAQVDVITYTAQDASVENRYFRFRR